MGITSSLFKNEREKGGGGAAEKRNKSPSPGANKKSPAVTPNRKQAATPKTGTPAATGKTGTPAATGKTGTPAATPTNGTPKATREVDFVDLMPAKYREQERILREKEGQECSGKTGAASITQATSATSFAKSAVATGTTKTKSLGPTATPSKANLTVIDYKDTALLPVVSRITPFDTPEEKPVEKPVETPAAETPTLNKKGSSASQNVAETNKGTPTDVSSVATEGGNEQKEKAKKKEIEKTEKTEGKGAEKGSKKSRIPLWCWIVIGFIAIAVIVAVIVFIFIYKSDSTNAPIAQPTTLPSSTVQPTPTCTTSVCSGYAAALITGMNKETEPCDNFHGYACGKHDYSKDKMSFTGSDQVKALMDDNNATYTGLMLIAKKLYDTCLSGTSDEDQIREAQNVVSRYVGAVPPLHLDVVNKLASEGFTNFGHFKLDMDRLMDPNEINPKTVLIIQNRTKFDSDKDFGFKKIVSSNVSKQFGVFDSSENKLKPANETLIPLADLEKSIPDDKKKPLIKILEGWFPNGTSQEFMLANVWTYKYEYWTKPIDESVDINDARIQDNVISFHEVIAKKELEKSFKTIVFDKKDCYALVAKTIPQAFVKFDNNHIDKNKEEKIKGMVEEYKTKQVDMLKEFNVDDATRTELITKVKEIEIVVGCPEQYATNVVNSSAKIDQTKMSEIYGIYPQVKKHQLLQHFAHLAKPNENPPAFGIWQPSTIYNSDRNTLYLNPRLLDDQSFDEGLPSYVKHGGVGVVIGKALADVMIHHASNTARYNQSAKCYREEREDRPYGKSTRDELIGDHIGALESYQMAKKGGTAPFLPGFESHNNDKMYFLSMAKRMCATPYDGFPHRNDADELKKIGKERINGLVTNMPQFAAAFKCPVAAPMHKTTKCTMY